MIKLNKKKDYITFLSVISVISVVILHTNGCFWAFSDSRYWHTANIIECVFYFAVPIFFMISGITLIDYRDKYSTKEYFKKRVTKTLIPFIVWSIIAVLYYAFYLNRATVSDLSFKYIFNGILGTKFITIYWFFIPLFIVYLTIPIFSSIEKKKRHSVFMYVIIVGLILNSLLPLINDIFKLELNLPIKLIIGTEYISYVLIGYLIDNNKITNSTKKTIYILGIIGLIVHIVMTYFVSKDLGYVVRTYKGYNNVPCILYSIAVFVFLKNFFEKHVNNKAKIMNVINIMGKYTFIIYLMHWYIMEIIQKEFELNTLSIIYRLGMPFLVIPLCMLVAYILRKIPIIKHIVP